MAFAGKRLTIAVHDRLLHMPNCIAHQPLPTCIRVGIWRMRTRRSSTHLRRPGLQHELCHHHMRTITWSLGAFPVMSSISPFRLVFQHQY